MLSSPIHTLALNKVTRIAVCISWTRVAGDSVYGDGTWNRKWSRRAQRPLLHALQLEVQHPTRDVPLQLRAPPPEDIRSLGAELAGCDGDEKAFDGWLNPRLQAAISSNE